MSTIKITASGSNDTAAIQADINKAVAGDTIDFAAGVYHLSTATLKSGVTLHGEAGAVIQATTADSMLTVDSSNSQNITIDGLTFIGTGASPTTGAIDLSGDGSSSSVNNITISNSTFQNNGLTFDFVKNSHITGDHFTNIGGAAAAIYGYHLDNSSISGNTFTNTYQGLGLVFGGGTNQGRNVVVADNVGTGMSRMGIEIIGQDPPQSGETTNLLVEGNSFSNWVHPVSDGSTMAYSIVTDGGIGTQVLNNYAHDTGNVGYGIELSGVGAVAEGNYIDGFATGIIGYSSADVIQNNNIIHYSSEMVSSYDRTDEIISNNTSDPSMPLPISSDGTTSPTPVPAPSPSPVPVVEPFTLPESAAATDSLTGHAGLRTLNGTSHADHLDGLGLTHRMAGGAGDDYYVVHTSSDVVVEKPGQGIDTVEVWANGRQSANHVYTIPANVENMVLKGDYAHTASGNSLNNIITASDHGNDVINGGGGNDIIVAGGGADVLTGGAGHDIFSFSHLDTGSSITDFKSGMDLLDLHSLMKSASYAGTNPIADHTMALVSDGSGGTNVELDLNHTGTMHTVVDLHAVASSSLRVGVDILWH